MAFVSRQARRSVAGALAGVGVALAGVIGMVGGAGPAGASSQIEGAFAKGQLAAVAASPEVLYPTGLRFDVVRDGSVIGSHRTTFHRDGNVLRVESRMALEIGFLGLTLYDFAYAATGTWRDGVPVALDARTNDNGEARRVQARWDGGLWHVDGGNGGAWSHATPLLPTNHWNPAVLDQTAVLNTLTGRKNSVTIVPGPVEQVQTGTGPRPARRFDYRGDLETTVWYDAQGRWVGLSFKGRDGVTVRYVCQDCGGGANG